LTFADLVLCLKLFEEQISLSQWFN